MSLLGSDVTYHLLNLLVYVVGLGGAALMVRRLGLSWLSAVWFAAMIYLCAYGIAHSFGGAVEAWYGIPPHDGVHRLR